MALIAPFRGLRYNPEKIANLEEVVTPPYDVIDERAQADLLRRNPFSMIRLDLSKSVKSEEMTEARYQQSRQLLDEWLAAGVLRRDETPAIYLYFIDYLHPSGRRLTRKGLVCLTGLAEFSEGIVKPHEQVFRGVVTDRLRLLDACRTQFSQVFSIFPDPVGEVMTLLEAAREAEPQGHCQDKDGCRHSLWRVSDPAAIAQARELFRSKCVYIADGHHRYNTALQMRELMASRQGVVAVDSPFNYAMMYLCPMEDPGLSVLPTHRLVRLPRRGAAALAELLASGFEAEEIRGGSREALVAEVLSRMDERRASRMTFGLYHPGEDRCFLLSLKAGAMEAAGFGAIPPELRQLDVVVLSELILGRYLGLDHHRCEAEHLIDYFSDPDEALDKSVKETLAGEGDSVVFLMNNTLVAQVRQVSDAGLIMPHKSTYFYPKIMTGLVMNQLVAEEKVDG
ncbi:MAG: DUF1015 domain-containing protein [Desulfobulbaceae bacterium]|nr:DUF1015 domain-containing protein [Desulfobulbaceae bacterium]